VSELRTAAENAAALAAWRGLNASLHALARGLFPAHPLTLRPRRVVVHLIDNIGDIVVAVPALMALRARYPEARLTLLTSPGARGAPGAAELLTGVSYLDALEVYYKDDIDSPTKQLALVGRVRSWAPDLMVFIPSSRVPPSTVYRNLAFARLCRPGAVFNYQVPSSPWFRLSQARSRARFPSEVDRHLASLAPLGVAHPESVSFELGRAPPADGEAIAALVRECSGDDRPVLAICPGGKQEGHLWPVDRFTEVARRARHECDAHVWLVGGPGDREAARAIREVVPDAVDLTGGLSILGTAALLGHADLMLSNDTGPMHLAVAAGTRVCAIFSSQDFAGRWYPYGDGHLVFRAADVCPVCLFGAARTQHCVSKIGTAEVARACVDALRQAVTARSRRDNEKCLESL